MQGTVYFLFTPRPILIELLRISHSPSLANLSEPIIWFSPRHRHRIHGLLPADAKLLAKLLFLISLSQEWSDKEGFSDVFEQFEITEEYFDALWSVSLRDVKMGMDTAIEYAIAVGSAPSLLEGTNTEIHAVLSRYLNPCGAEVL
jgi:hypothetical protein